MSSATLSITTDTTIIKKAQKNAKKLGISLYDLIQIITNRWLKDFANTQDADTLRIKAAALRNDLSEKQAMDIIDTIRQELPINKS